MFSKKPRESILCLFDPLSAPQTPPRETYSPDSSSDKENDGPQPGQLTAFFNRVYTIPKSTKTPKGKLIDFEGSSFADDSVEEDASDEENMQEGSSDARAAGNISESSPSMQRRPLVDIKLERTPPPGVQLPPTIMEEESPQPLPCGDQSTPWSEGPTILPLSATPAPTGTPLADVINSINLSAMSITDSSSEELVSQEVDDDDYLVADSTCPDINICAPESEPSSPYSSPPLNPSATAFLSPIASPPGQCMPQRRQHTTFSPMDPRRFSVDLHSSFSLQMQSSDMSFDLLNDKISILDHGQDSFWSGMGSEDAEDDTMDLARVEMKMKVVAEKYESIKEAEEIKPLPTVNQRTPPKLLLFVDNDANSSTPLRAPVFSLPKASPTGSMGSLISDANSAEIAVAPFASLREVVHSSPSPKLATPSTALPHVPALRIMKKSFKIHDRTGSSSSTGTSDAASRLDEVSSASSSRCTSRAESHSSISLERISTPEAKVEKPRTTIRGLQRPPPGAKVPPAPSRTTGPMRALASSARAISSALSQTSSREATRPSGAPSATAPSRSNLVQRPTANLPPTQTIPASKLHRPAISGTSTLRPPSRPTAMIGSASTAAASGIPGVRSGLPRPASRLPAPSKMIGGKPGSSNLRRV